MSDNAHEAWDAFWQRNAQGGSGGSGCLPGAGHGIDQALRKVWHRFARQLPKGARVLDLATGDGQVMAALLEERRDLKPLGIDRATPLPEPPRGAKMRGGTSMESLPLADESFAGVTSQFGFEYGDIESVAREVFRVLRPNGRVALLTHRAGSPILEHNRIRKEQIAWAIDERDLPGIARRSIGLRQLGAVGVPPEIASAPGEGARQYGAQSAAWEIAEAIRRTMVGGGNAPAAHALGIIAEIASQARNELARIAALERAAATAGQGEAIEAALRAAGLALVSCEALTGESGRAPLATFLTFIKPK